MTEPHRDEASNTVRYDARRDRVGWTVFDRWTGRSVVLGGAEQCGLDWNDAEELVAQLNRPGQSPDRSILQ